MVTQGDKQMAQTRANLIESNRWIADMQANAAKDCVNNALEQLRRMLADVEREMNREGASTAQVVQSFRHTILWGVANMESHLANADKYAHEAATAEAVIAALNTPR
jgi:hypothetical protein